MTEDNQNNDREEILKMWKRIYPKNPELNKYDTNNENIKTFITNNRTGDNLYIKIKNEILILSSIFFLEKN